MVIKMIPMDIRHMIIANWDSGMKVGEISRKLKMNRSTVSKLIKRYEETGTLESDFQKKMLKTKEEQK